MAYPKRRWFNTMRCKPRFSSSSLFSVSSNAKQKNRILCSKGWNGGRQRDEEHPSSNTNCWEWTRLPVRKRSHNRNLWRGRTCVWGIQDRIRTHTHTHRHTERHKEVSLISNNYNNEQPTFTKGYKVTLYSDSLRATALYAIYINGLNLGYPRG